MSAAELLQWAEAEGVNLTVKQRRICWQAEQAPPPELLERIKEHKQEVIDTITQHYRDTLARAAGVPWHWLVAYYFTPDDIAEIEGGRFTDPAALGAFIKTDPQYPFGWVLH